VFRLFNPSKAELNPICHLLALLGAHHILHVSGVRVNMGKGCESEAMKRTRWKVICLTQASSLMQCVIMFSTLMLHIYCVHTHR